MKEEMANPQGAPVLPALDLEALAKTIGSNARASAVFGEPIKQGELIVVPVARTIWGLGRGGSNGSNGGGGMKSEAVGYLEIRDGVAAFKPISRKSSFLALSAAGLALAIYLRRTRR